MKLYKNIIYVNVQNIHLFYKDILFDYGYLKVLENISKEVAVSLNICEIHSIYHQNWHVKSILTESQTFNKQKNQPRRSQTHWLRNVNCFSSIVSVPTVPRRKRQSITSGSCPLLPIPSRLSLILSISLERRRAGGMLGAGKTWTWPPSSGLHRVSSPNLPDDRWIDSHTHTTHTQDWHHTLTYRYRNFGHFHKYSVFCCFSGWLVISTLNWYFLACTTCYLFRVQSWTGGEATRKKCKAQPLGTYAKNIYSENKKERFHNYITSDITIKRRRHFPC